MRQIIYTLLTLCCVLLVQRSNAQQIVKAEYFINQDPGFDQGTLIALPPPSSDMALNFNIDVSASNPGFNLLFIRVKDSESRWSHAIIKPFYKQVLWEEAPQMAMIEYFINQDHGYGQGIPISVPANSTDISVSFDIDVSAVNDGFNLLFIRSKDTEGRWSQTIIRPFYKQVFSESAIDISYMEYFIDNDPGFGQGVPVTFSGTDQVEAIFDIDVSNLTDGFHKLFIRSRDNFGRWSITIQRPFYKQTFSGLPPEIVEAEYYFSTDPGLGQGHSIPIPQPAIHLEDFTAFVSYHDLPVGIHQMFLRVKTANGSWSHISTPQQICRLPIPDFEAATVYDGFETSFVNLSTLTDENTEFFWDVDGNGEIDYTGPNDFIHFYPGVGTYLAKLIVVSQEGCADTLTKEVHVVNCLPPNDAFVDEITDVTAAVNWIPANIEMSYAIEYGLTGFTPGTGALINNIAATEYTIGDLLPLTMYDVYLRSNCTISMMSEWEGPIQFETSSAAGVLLGDANCDEMVNVLDVVTIIDFLLENNPVPFCFENADYDEDGDVTVLDAVAVIGFLLGMGKSDVVSQAADIYLAHDLITLKSDGTMTALHFELSQSSTESIKLELIPDDFVLSYRTIGSRIIGLIMHMQNKPLPEGNIDLLKVTNSAGLSWVSAFGANISAKQVKINMLQSPASGYQLIIAPNPSDGSFSLHYSLAEESMVQFRIVDAMGKLVLESERLLIAAGQQHNELNQRNLLKPGIYTLHLTLKPIAGGELIHVTEKLIVVK